MGTVLNRGGSGICTVRPVAQQSFGRRLRYRTGSGFRLLGRPIGNRSALELYLRGEHAKNHPFQVVPTFFDSC